MNGAKVANIQVGVTEKGYTTKEGTKVEDRTDWFYVVAWRGLAEVIEKFVGKGDKLYIEGRMRSRQYDAKDGSKRSKHYYFESSYAADRITGIKSRNIRNCCKGKQKTAGGYRWFWFNHDGWLKFVKE